MKSETLSWDFKQWVYSKGSSWELLLQLIERVVAVGV